MVGFSPATADSLPYTVDVSDAETGLEQSALTLKPFPFSRRSFVGWRAATVTQQWRGRRTSASIRRLNPAGGAGPTSATKTPLPRLCEAARPAALTRGFNSQLGLEALTRSLESKLGLEAWARSFDSQL